MTKYVTVCYLLTLVGAASACGLDTSDMPEPDAATPEVAPDVSQPNPVALGLPVSAEAGYCDPSLGEVSPCQWTAMAESVVFGTIVEKRLSTEYLFSTAGNEQLDEESCGPFFEESLIVTVRTQMAAGELSVGTDVELHFGYDTINSWEGDPMSESILPIGGSLGAQVMKTSNGIWTPMLMPLFAATELGEISFSPVECSIGSPVPAGATVQQLFDEIASCSFGQGISSEPNQALWAGICFNAGQNGERVRCVEDGDCPGGTCINDTCT